jgi:hypothetical protein
MRQSIAQLVCIVLASVDQLADDNGDFIRVHYDQVPVEHWHDG